MTPGPLERRSLKNTQGYRRYVAEETFAQFAGTSLASVIQLFNFYSSTGRLSRRIASTHWQRPVVLIIALIGNGPGRTRQAVSETSPGRVTAFKLILQLVRVEIGS